MSITESERNATDEKSASRQRQSMSAARLIDESADLKLRLAAARFEPASSKSYEIFLADAADSPTEAPIWEADQDAFLNCSDAAERPSAAEEMPGSSESSGRDAMPDMAPDSWAVESE